MTQFASVPGVRLAYDCAGAGERFGQAVGDQARQGPVPLLRVGPRRVQPGRRYRLIAVAKHGEQAAPALPVGALVTLAAARLASLGTGAARLMPGARGDDRAVAAAGPVSGAHERAEFHDRNRPSRRQAGFGGQQ